MKRIIALLILCSVLGCLVSCGNETSDGTDIVNTTDTNVETEADVWPIFETVDCTVHHRDYHIIPYRLAKEIGIDECNAWAIRIRANEVKVPETEAVYYSTPSTDTTATTEDEPFCGCPEFNVRAFIDDFEVSREDFVSYGELIALGTYDTAILYERTPEEIEEYFLYREELIDLTIKSQHFAFIEKSFQYDYISELYDMIIYDNEVGIGIYPSIPQIVQALDISRETLEEIIDECTAKNIKIYGRSFNYEYDLSLIYNEDGSFAALPTFDGLTDSEVAMKLDRLFCGRDS